MLKFLSDQGGVTEGEAMDRVGRLKFAARMWIRHNETFHEFMARHPSICHIVRYEDLTERAEPTVRRVLEFLGEPWEPGVLDYAAFPHSGLGDPEIAKFDRIRPNSGNYRSWTQEEQDAVRTILAGHLQRYAYTSEQAAAR
jgi:hypothetical protein